MKIESDRMAGLSVEQRERLVEVVEILCDRMIDNVQKGSGEVLQVTLNEGQIHAFIGLNFMKEPYRFEPLTEWSTDFAEQISEPTDAS